MDRLEFGLGNTKVNALVGHWIAAILFNMPEAERNRVIEEVQRLEAHAIRTKDLGGLVVPQ